MAEETYPDGIPVVPAGPLEREPAPLFLPAEVRHEVLLEILKGVQLGAWDRRIVGWLANLDTSTTLTIASLIQRAKAAGEAAADARETETAGR
jgi:hypothetical protein